jgi:hypothetical protein
MTISEMVDTVDAGQIEQAVREMLEWCATQTPEQEVWPTLFPVAGDGGPVADPPPVPAAVRRERYRVMTRQRMGRMLGHRKGDRWAGREQGKGAGPFNPAEITPEQAASILVIVRRYVAYHASAWSTYPLTPDGQENAVSRIVHAIWTRDYARSNVRRGNLSGAVWQACGLYRKTAWIGEDVFHKREAKRCKKRGEMPEGDVRDLRRAPCDNPATIAAAIEQAERGLWAPAVVNRGRKQARRARGGKRMASVRAGDAREVLCGE